jgi:transcriptional regulator with XRE-family HTH domain
MIEKQIADKIKLIRKSRRMTLAQLGEVTQLSKGLLSRIENNRVSPPIATLSKIAQGLEVPIGIFFEDADTGQSKFAVTHKEDRRQVVRAGKKIGFVYYSLTQLKSPHIINPFIVRYPIIKKDPGHFYDHPGEEFLMVLKGEIQFVYGKEKIHLKEGDAFHFDPTIPHRGYNIGEEESECLIIVVGEQV